jgi:hypothetical protein
VDLVAVVEPEAQDGFAARWRIILDGIAPVVLWWSPRGIKTLVSAVTEDWLRCDLFMVPPGALGQRAKSNLAALIEPGGLHGTLPARCRSPRRTPSASKGSSTSSCASWASSPWWWGAASTSWPPGARECCATC